MNDEPPLLNLQYIVSGGQTGVDRAALDAALALDLPHRGWCPRGRLAEDGVISPRYQLVETESSEYSERTERNVIDSDGTLLLFRTARNGGAELTYRMTVKHRKPCLPIDLAAGFQVAIVRKWLKDQRIGVLNIAGPRESSAPGIYHQTHDFLHALLVLSGDELLSYVRHVAEDLVARLAAGQRETLGWASQAETVAIVNDAVTACLDSLAKTGCWGEANRLASSELWRIARAWLETGDLLTQARLKPRGYAGDFDLLAKISDDWRCEHPLGRALDQFFQSQAAPRAVRHRTQIVARAIVEQCRQTAPTECHVVSVGSGPARDVEGALAALSPDERTRVRVTLLDLDPAALEYAAGRLASFLPAERLCCARENLFRLATNPRAAALLRGANILSCVGFFDYLADPDAAGLLALFWRELSPGGRMLVFNFTPTNPSRALMEWVGNWYLVYRDLPDLAGLALLAGLPSEKVCTGAEELGVDALLTAQK